MNQTPRAGTPGCARKVFPDPESCFFPSPIHPSPGFTSSPSPFTPHVFLLCHRKLVLPELLWVLCTCRLKTLFPFPPFAGRTGWGGMDALGGNACAPRPPPAPPPPARRD